MQPLVALALAAAFTLTSAAPRSVFRIDRSTAAAPPPTEYCFVNPGSGSQVCNQYGFLASGNPIIVKQPMGLTFEQCMVQLNNQSHSTKRPAQSASYDGTTSPMSTCTLYAATAEANGFTPSSSNVTFVDESCLSCTKCKVHLKDGSFDDGRLYASWHNGSYGQGARPHLVRPGYLSPHAVEFSVGKEAGSESYIYQYLNVCPTRYTMTGRYKASMALSGGNATFLVENNIDVVVNTTSFTGDWQYFKKTYMAHPDGGKPNYEVAFGVVNFGRQHRKFNILVDSITFTLAQ